MQTLAQAHQHNDGVYFGDYPEWLIAYTTYRDADVLTRANFDALVLELSEDSDTDWTIERSGHWAVGWIDYLIVKPNTNAETIASTAHDELTEYPVLNDERLSDYEHADGEEVWYMMNMRDRIRMLAENDESIFAARAGYMELYERAERTYYACQEW